MSDARAACTTTIADYAVIGDCRSAALISRDGSLDWLCLPEFASPAIFGALLNQPSRREATGPPPEKVDGGCFRIRPSVPAVATRRYLSDSNLLETTFRANDGTVRVLDLMSLPDERQFQPMREVLRIVTGVEGRVPMAFEIDPCPGYGLTAPRLAARAPGEWAWVWGKRVPLPELGPGIHPDRQAPGW